MLLLGRPDQHCTPALIHLQYSRIPICCNRLDLYLANMKATIVFLHSIHFDVAVAMQLTFCISTDYARRAFAALVVLHYFHYAAC